MNKLQKRMLVEKRRFHQHTMKLRKRLVLADTETAGLNDVGAPAILLSPNKEAIAKLTLKELEYILNSVDVKDDVNKISVDLKKALSDELFERRTLADKINLT